MTEEELRAIEARTAYVGTLIVGSPEFTRIPQSDVPVLCAEVRRLQALVDQQRRDCERLRDLLRENDERKAELGHQNERLREEAKRLRRMLPVDTAAALLHDWAEPA